MLARSCVMVWSDCARSADVWSVGVVGPVDGTSFVAFGLVTAGGEGGSAASAAWAISDVAGPRGSDASLWAIETGWAHRAMIALASLPYREANAAPKMHIANK